MSSGTRAPLMFDSCQLRSSPTMLRLPQTITGQGKGRHNPAQPWVLATTSKHPTTTHQQLPSFLLGIRWKWVMGGRGSCGGHWLNRHALPTNLLQYHIQAILHFQANDELEIQAHVRRERWFSSATCFIEKGSPQYNCNPQSPRGPLMAVSRFTFFLTTHG